MSYPQPTIVTRLERDYRCRDEEGGCGALPGECCKTHRHHNPTVPHADRWHQWERAGSPGAWYNRQGNGTAEALIDEITRNLAAASENLAKLSAVVNAQP